LKHDQDGAVLRFIFKGTFKGKEHPFINLDHYRHVPKKALHTIIVPKFLEVEQQSHNKPILTKREAFEDLLLGQFEISEKSVDEYVSLVEDSLKIVESANSIADQERQLTNRYTRFAKRSLARFATQEN
jgi:hypothetical protein